MPKHYLALHTIFIPSENIQWLEEFLVYYIHNGFDHFYLYDNEGSIGRNSSTPTKNKYGFPIQKSSDHTNKLVTILQTYGDYITYRQWQPKNAAGDIIYGQHESIADCMKHYGADNEWIAFMDLDEFIYSPAQIHIPDYLKSQEDTVSCVRLTQKKFIDRFLSAEKFVTQEFHCIPSHRVDVRWGRKNIVRCKDFLSSTEIHHGFILQGDIKDAPPAILRFNHYNVNDALLTWMKGFFNLDTTPPVDEIDSGMRRYKYLFDKS